MITIYDCNSKIDINKLISIAAIVVVTFYFTNLCFMDLLQGLKAMREIVTTIHTIPLILLPQLLEERNSNVIVNNESRRVGKITIRVLIINSSNFNLFKVERI